MDYTICIGTVGSGLWVSYNSGGKFRHIFRGPEPESNCRALAVSPHRQGELLVSLDRVGVFRSEDNGGNWERIGTDIGTDIWSLAYDPHDADRLYVGTRPGISRSTDGGATFEALDTSINPICPIGVPRTTNVIVDPAGSQRVWASVEVDGLHRSEDGGDTWTALGPIGPSEFHADVHGFTMRPVDGGTELLVTTPFGLARSRDDAQTWDWHAFDGFPGTKFEEYAYCRCVRAPWGGETILVCCGDYIPGAVGAVEVSRDGGESWKRADLPVTPNSTMYWLATNEDLPGVVVATSVFGQVYVSDDHAETWRKLDREFGEIRAVTVTAG
jgi:photosystem II stability/assembly factor-like uncharacterized protein